jgi:diacylglycerol kinase (ATP)
VWAIVINPVSGGGRGAVLGREVAGYFASHALEYTVITATSANKLKTNLALFLDLHKGQSCEGVIAVGGDGLAHLVIQLVAPRKIPFTVIPAGTGNDLVRSMGWDLGSITKQLDFVTTTDATPIDLGMVDSEWFGAILSTGFDSVVNERANTMSWPKGPMRYNLAIAIELPRFKPLSYTIELDTQLLQVEAMLIAVANGKSYGGGMLVCPDASMSDGLFDVMILHPVSKVEFIKVFPKVFKGAHKGHPQVRFYRSARVSISSAAVAYADGERIGGLPVRAECMAGAGLSWTP